MSTAALHNTKHILNFIIHIRCGTCCIRIKKVATAFIIFKCVSSVDLNNSSEQSSH